MAHAILGLTIRHQSMHSPDYEAGVTAGIEMASRCVGRILKWHEWNLQTWLRNPAATMEHMMFYERINECRASIRQIDLLARAPEYRDEMLTTPLFWEKKDA